MAEVVRINKYLSEAGVCSRREADREIAQGNITINGKKAIMGDKVFPGDKVMFREKIVSVHFIFLFILFYGKNFLMW